MSGKFECEGSICDGVRVLGSQENGSSNKLAQHEKGFLQKLKEVFWTDEDSKKS